MCLVEVLLNLQEKDISESTATIWHAVFVICTVLWAKYDAQENRVSRPFDFDFLVYVFWPVAFPWYLLKTRGVEGLLLLFGFMWVLLIPWLSGLVAYVYFT